MGANFSSLDAKTMDFSKQRGILGEESVSSSSSGLLSSTTSSVKSTAIQKMILPLIDKATADEMKRLELIEKRIYLPKCDHHITYYEREAKTMPTTSASKEKPPQTLLMLHGIGGDVGHYFGLLSLLDVPDTVRVLIPEQLFANGKELKRAFKARGTSATYECPDVSVVMESMPEFLDLTLGKYNGRCNAMGMSLGGLSLYYLKHKRPNLVDKTVLLTPSILSCLQDKFLNDLSNRDKNFNDFRSRSDVKTMFRDILWTDPEKRRLRVHGDGAKKDPIPKFVYDIIFELYKRDIPQGFNKSMTDMIPRYANGDIGEDVDDNELFTTAVDIDPTANRLVIWPEEDQICDYEKGKRFFPQSSTTTFVSISRCGHVLNEAGKDLPSLAAPIMRSFLLDFGDDGSGDSDGSSKEQ